MLVSLDIETAPGNDYLDNPDAALDHHRNRITQIAWADSTGYKTIFNGPNQITQLNAAIKKDRQYGPKFGGHNFKFDLKTLITKGAHLTPEDYHWDTMLQAVANPHKIPDSWLADYEKARQSKNETLGKQVHRQSGKHGLKTLAPFHLGIDPFWEVEGHDDAAYALKDASYTLDLHLNLAMSMDPRASKFYEEKLIRWARMLLRAELKGIAIDQNALLTSETYSNLKAARIKKELKQIWAEPMSKYENLEIEAIDSRYTEMKTKAMAKSKKADKTSIEKRYNQLAKEAMTKIQGFNFNSPTQLKWLMKEYYGLDIETFEGDESTGKSVLERLKSEGREDIGKFLEYRKHSKLASAFFPSYKAMQWKGRIHPSFNLNGTRTGRLSCSEPNLQQVPGHLHKLFVPKPGYKLINQDLSNIEPILIAYLTECPALTDIVINGRSFHNVNAKVFFDLECDDSEVPKLFPKERKIAKTLGLLLIYGGGPRRIMVSAMSEGVTITLTQAKSMYDRFRKKYEAVFEYKKKLDQRLENGEVLYNLLGRPYMIENRDDVYMKGLNTFIQGSASDLLVESVTRAEADYQAAGIDCSPLLLVHDETIQEVREDQGEQAMSILLSRMLGYTLQTEHGTIKLKSEGGLNDYWAK